MKHALATANAAPAATPARKRRPVKTAAPRARGLHQQEEQEANFTAEGSPPPGLVSGAPPLQTGPPVQPDAPGSAASAKPLRDSV